MGPPFESAPCSPAALAWLALVSGLDVCMGDRVHHPALAPTAMENGVLVMCIASWAPGSSSWRGASRASVPAVASGTSGAAGLLGCAALFTEGTL